MWLHLPDDAILHPELSVRHGDVLGGIVHELDETKFATVNPNAVIDAVAKSCTMFGAFGRFDRIVHLICSSGA